MRLSEELRDPWTLLLTGVAMGSALAVEVPLAGAVAVGAAVLGVKSIVSRFTAPSEDASVRMLPVRDNSPELRWLKRAEKAVRSFTDLAEGGRAGPVAARTQEIGSRACTTLEAMRRLAGQTSAIAFALRHLDGTKLAAEEDRLLAEVKQTRDDEVREELKRALGSIRSQLDVYSRLNAAGRTLLARMESGTIGLEALVARLAEVTALSETATPAQGLERIQELSDELEGLRSGLVETEDLSRRALSAYQEAAG